MRAARPPGDSIVALSGWPRIPSSAPVPRQVRRPANLAFDMAWLAGGLPASLARHRVDGWYSPAVTMPLFVRHPSVVTIHDLNFIVRADDYDPGYVRFATRMVRSAAERAERIVTDSRFVREMVIKAFGVSPGRIRAIPAGIDHLDASSTDPDSWLPRPYALFVGQTEPHKNVGLLLDAWRAGVPPDLNLVIAGPPGRDEAALRHLAEHPALRDRVFFAGHLPTGRLRAAYRDAQLFVFPSLAEGFGFPPLEAMAMGIPTAVSSATCLPEVTDGGALVFDPADAEGLARVVTRMSQDEGLRATLRVEGPAVAERYRWSATADAIWEEIHHALGA